MRSRLGWCMIATFLLVSAFGCGYLRDRALFQDARHVVPLLPKAADGSVHFSMGAFEGGTAVLGEQDTAFWVKEGVPYTVSEAARNAAPGMAQAPETIQYNEEFIAAVGGEL